MSPPTFEQDRPRCPSDRLTGEGSAAKDLLFDMTANLPLIACAMRDYLGREEPHPNTSIPGWERDSVLDRAAHSGREQDPAQDCRFPPGSDRWGGRTKSWTAWKV